MNRGIFCNGLWDFVCLDYGVYVLGLRSCVLGLGSFVCLDWGGVCVGFLWVFCASHSDFCSVPSGSLGSHLSANGTECYITSDMFYVEVQLDPTGLLCDVKVAHHGENPVVCIPGERGTLVLLGLPFTSLWFEQREWVVFNVPVTPLLLVRVGSKILHGVVCSCGII